MHHDDSPRVAKVLVQIKAGRNLSLALEIRELLRRERMCANKEMDKIVNPQIYHSFSRSKTYDSLQKKSQDALDFLRDTCGVETNNNNKFYLFLMWGLITSSPVQASHVSNRTEFHRVLLLLEQAALGLDKSRLVHYCYM
jgi:hypothetical protein